MIFEPGDCLVVYSDGVTDMTDASDEAFGERRLEGAVKRLRGRGAEEIAQGVFERVQAHRADTEAFDDVALVVVNAV